MPKFIMKARYSSEAFRGVITDPIDRKETTKQMLQSAGVKLHEWYFAPDKGESYVIAEGTHDQVTLARMVAMATGAFVDSESIQIITSNELLVLTGNANSIGKEYVAPNMDQVDRMLLDE